MSVDVIFGEQAFAGLDARPDRDALWLSDRDFSRVSGYSLKPEGFCKEQVCIPVPPARKGELVSDGRYNLAAFAGLLGRPVIHDSENSVWCVGEAAAERKRALQTLKAPDFTLPDLEGRPHSLSEHRGKKVFLVSWASW